MLNLLITILLCSSIPMVLGDKIYRHKSSAADTLNGFLASESAKSIGIVKKCLTAQGAHEEQCMLDISGFSKENIKKLLDKAEEITPSVRCANSTLTELDFSPLTKLGHRVDRIPLKDNEPALVIVDNLQLKNISLGDVFRRGYMYPRFFTIYNNPQLSRDSIDRIKLMVSEQIKELGNKIGYDYNRLLVEKILIQNYGECDFQMLNPGKTSLSWEEFRWCKTVLHDVTLEGDEFHSELDTANIIEVKGCLKIKNTKITDLTMLPNRFIDVKRGCSEITGNKDLCVSYDDGIRLKAIGFEIKDNKKMSCRGVPVITKAPTSSTTNAPTSTTEAPTTTSTTEAPTTKTSTTEEPTTSTSSAPTTTVITSTTNAPTSTTEAPTTTSTTEAPTTTSTTEAPTTKTSTIGAPTTTSSTEASTSTTNAPINKTSTTEEPTTSTSSAPTTTVSTSTTETSTSTTNAPTTTVNTSTTEASTSTTNAPATTSTTEEPTPTSSTETSTSTTNAPTTTSSTEASTSTTNAPATTSTTEEPTPISSAEASTSTKNAPTSRTTPTARAARVSTSTASSVKIDPTTVKSGIKTAVQKKDHFEKASGNVNATELKTTTPKSGTGQIDVGRVMLSIVGPIFALGLFR